MAVITIVGAGMIIIGKGILKKEDFPLLLHIDEIICNKAKVNIPWESFTYES